MLIPDSIDWSKSNIEIHNLIRASVVPFPGVYTFWKGLKLYIKKSVSIKTCSLRANFGVVEKIDEMGVVVTTGNGKLLITEIEFEAEVIPNTKLHDFGLRFGDQLRDRAQLSHRGNS